MSVYMLVLGALFVLLVLLVVPLMLLRKKSGQSETEKSGLVNSLIDKISKM